MPSDRSRRTDPTRFGYKDVVAQQGRVVLDRDFNAAQGLTADRIAADALDFVGPCGTPDDGFRISLPIAPLPPIFSPPAGLPQESPPVTVGGAGDFLIAPGTMYVGGQRAEFFGAQNGKPVSYSYFAQPDFIDPPRRKKDQERELIVLELTELEVSAVEDPDLLEVALGGPDTTQRLKLLRQVLRLPVTASTCTAAWNEWVKRWAEQGLAFDPATMRLLPQARLEVGFTTPAGSGDPCDPVATGGYLGADNQLIRARIAQPTGGPQLIWSYDNASFLYRATPVSGDATRLTLAAAPPDNYHVPQTGQLVEVLAPAAVLASEPDESDPTGQAQILRLVAEPTGDLFTLAAPYGPQPGGDPTSYIVLNGSLSPQLANSTLPLFLRVWQGSASLPAGGGTVTLTDPVTSTSTGVTATITVPTGMPLWDGSFWQIAVRPATPQGVYPEDLLTEPQPPDGPRRWVCPLAVINWRTHTVTDCRSCFDNLVTLSRRKPGCCTVSIGTDDVTAATPLQTLIDRAAAQADTVTVCLSPGVYALPSPLRLTQAHAGLTLESCGGPALLRADTAAAAGAFADGLVVLTGAGGVTLRGLTLTVPLTATQ
jgi:Family of unknown function (DUF6519)